MKHILIITPSDLIATAFQSILQRSHLRTTCLTQVNNWQKSLQPCPDILFLDDTIVTSSPNGYAHLAEIQHHHSNMKIVMVSLSCEPAVVWRLVESGVSGYLYLQDRLVPRIPLIIDDVANGGLFLSPTAQAALTSIRFYHDLHLTDYQLNVLHFMTKQFTAPQIANELDRTTAAIYQVQKTLREIFDVETNGQLVQKVRSLELQAYK